MVKVVGPALELSTKGFEHWTNTDLKIWVKSSVSAIQYKGNSKSLTRGFPLIDQANPFAYSCSFTLQKSFWSQGDSV